LPSYAEWVNVYLEILRRIFKSSASIGFALIFIRGANHDDNAELLDLEKMCPQGTNLVLQFDRVPFPGHWLTKTRVYVAEEEGKIVGTVGATLKTFNVSGALAKGIYTYDLRVHPSLRGSHRE